MKSKSTRPSKPPRLTEAEWKVMGVVWAGAPVTVRQVVDAVEAETGWAYSTVKTLLGRLVEKGVLSTEKRGAAGIFEPLVSEREARGSALRALVDRAFQGTVGSLVHHLVAEESLSESEQEELRSWLEDPDEAEEESRS